MKYEILFIVRPDLEENAIKDVFKKFEPTHNIFCLYLYSQIASLVMSSAI